MRSAAAQSGVGSIAGRHSADVSSNADARWFNYIVSR